MRCRCNPLLPAYDPRLREPRGGDGGCRAGSTLPEGLVEIGHAGRRLRFDNEAPRHRVLVGRLPRRRPAGDQRRLARLHRRRRLSHRPTLWLSDGWAAGAAPRAGRRRCTGSAASRGWHAVHARPACARSSPPRRSATSATTRPTLSRAGPARACRPRRSGRWPPRCPAAATLARHRAGNGPPAPTCPIPASARRRARSASTTASSWSARWSCAAARCATPPGHTRAELPQFLPARCALAVQHAAPGGGCGMSGALARDAAEAQRAALVADALAGLSGPRKTLPCKWLYDAEGARLFEAITRLPEYYPTRTETKILTEQAEAIAAAIGPGVAVGSSAPATAPRPNCFSPGCSRRRPMSRSTSRRNGWRPRPPASLRPARACRCCRWWPTSPSPSLCRSGSARRRGSASSRLHHRQFRSRRGDRLPAAGACDAGFGVTDAARRRPGEGPGGAGGGL